MILPIYAYGHPVLRKETEEIDKDYPELHQLVFNMFETMYQANGVGIAAPQVGIPIRLFLVDTAQIEEDEEKGLKMAFINPEILEETGEDCLHEEGCLSIPKVRGDVSRPEKVKIRFFDIDFNEYIEEFDGYTARVIQHEYDHIEGILFTDLLKPIKKRLIKRRLEKIKQGDVDAEYRMKFGVKRR